jgi:hypothetical protein
MEQENSKTEFILLFSNSYKSLKVGGESSCETPVWMLADPLLEVRKNFAIKFFLKFLNGGVKGEWYMRKI